MLSKRFRIDKLEDPRVVQNTDTVVRASDHRVSWSPLLIFIGISSGLSLCF